MLNLTRLTTPERPAPPPLEANDVAVVTGGTVLWFLLFLAQLPFYGWFQEHGYTWWVWTCLAGAGLGLIGIKYTRNRRAALLRHRGPAPADPAGPAAAAVPADVTKTTDGTPGERNA
ncbi:DUF2530 domain-containing protein [Streptomyces sp. NPDC059506]|uniref:DUF2530 domain-containing protein n=1 Tax=Streptomyces sp. NPDC059506 TaxID=3347751 RepID=UPI0036863807